MATISDMQRGIELLIPYALENTTAEHDIIYFWPANGTQWSEDMPVADELKELGGWHWNDDLDTWAYFT